jgi:4-hydroxymandelate oxidase
VPADFSRPTMRSVALHPARPSPDAATPPPPIDLDLLEQTARLAVGEMAYAYYAGAADRERQLTDNRAAWDRWRLHPRVLVDVSGCTTATTVLGRPVRSPVLVGPTAIQGLAHPDGERAIAVGAAAAGAAMILSSLATCALEDVAAAAPDGLRWMQVYVFRDRSVTADLVARAVDTGYRALVLTVDAPVAGLRLREIREGVHLPDDLALANLGDTSTRQARRGGFMAVVSSQFDPTLSYDDIGWLADVSGLPVVVKGVLRADDAVRCVDAGAAAVVVSNHGARQLDDGPATADVLAEVADAVGGRAEVYVDGGLRRPADVAKALALGARAVLLGRPVIWSLATGGSDGVADLLTWFEAELRRTMALCGAPTVADLDRSLVRPAP